MPRRRGAERRASPPDQAAEKGRRDLCRRGEGEQANRDQRRLAGSAIVEITEQDHEEDAQSPDDYDLRAEIAAKITVAFAATAEAPEGAAGIAQAPAAAQQQRHDEMVGDHDRERDGGDDHHRGRRGEAADEDDERDHTGLALQR